MDVLGLMAVLSFGLTCFGIGYSIGKASARELVATVQLHLSDYTKHSIH